MPDKFQLIMMFQSRGVCCVNIVSEGRLNNAKYSYIYNPQWPESGSGSANMEYEITWQPDTCFLRLEFLNLNMTEKSGNCVHDRLTVLGGKEKSGNLCGDRSGEVILVSPDKSRSNAKIILMMQSEKWSYNIGVAQVSCADVEKMRMTYTQDYAECGKKNPRFLYSINIAV